MIQIQRQIKRKKKLELQHSVTAAELAASLQLGTNGGTAERKKKVDELFQTLDLRGLDFPPSETKESAAFPINIFPTNCLSHLPNPQQLNQQLPNQQQSQQQLPNQQQSPNQQQNDALSPDLERKAKKTITTSRLKLKSSNGSLPLFKGNSASLVQQLKDQLIVAMDEIQVKDDIIQTLQSEQRIKDAAVIELTEKVLGIKTHIQALTANKNKQIQQLTSDLENVEQQFQDLHEMFTSKEEQMKHLVLQLQQKLDKKKNHSNEKNFQIQYWREQAMKMKEILEQGGIRLVTTELNNKILKQKEDAINELQTELSSTKQRLHESNSSQNLEIELAKKESVALKKQYFFALAVGMKLSLVSTGRECNLQIPTLWDECIKQSIPYSQWKTWIQHHIDDVQTF